MKTFIYPMIEYFIFIVLIVILLKLGQWQLVRAQQKTDILKQYQLMNSQSPTAWSLKAPLPQDYQPVILTGRPMGQLFYLDNQFYHHHVGFNVIVAIQMDDDAYVLVDLGWLPSGFDRQHLPRISLPKKTRWVGRAYYPPLQAIHLGNMIDHQQNGIIVIESVNLIDLEKLLSHHLQPWILRLNPSLDSSLKREWPVVNVMPQRHRAYALQWFVMAMVVGLILLWRIIQNAKK